MYGYALRKAAVCGEQRRKAHFLDEMGFPFFQRLPVGSYQIIYLVIATETFEFFCKAIEEISYYIFVFLENKCFMVYDSVTSRKLEGSTYYMKAKVSLCEKRCTRLTMKIVFVPYTRIAVR